MRGIRKQSSDTQSSSQPKEKRRLETKQKKGMLIGGGIFLVAVIALILVKNLTGGGGADGENVLYADSVGMITGTGLGTQNRFTGVVEAQDTLKLTLADNQKVKQIFVEKGQEVEPGTKLFEYDTEELAMTLDQGKLELEKITNNISSLNSQLFYFIIVLFLLDLQLKFLDLCRIGQLFAGRRTLLLRCKCRDL